MKEHKSPTLLQAKALQSAFDYFNETLFYNQLSPCMLRLGHHHRSRLASAASCQWGFTHNGDKDIHEISLHKAFFSYEPKFALSILVHEMVHVWQFEYGTPSNWGYHNKEWAFKMKEIGLVPSNTGRVGGKQIGEKMSHYLENTGRFEQAFNNLPETCLLPFTAFKKEQSLLKEGASGETLVNTKKESYNPAKRNRNKIIYVCTECSTKLYSNKEINVRCENCNVLFTLAPPKEKRQSKKD